MPRRGRTVSSTTLLRRQRMFPRFMPIMLQSDCPSSPFSSEGEPAEQDQQLQEYITEAERHRRSKEQWSTVWFSLIPCVSSIVGAFAVIRLILQVIINRGPFVLQFAILSVFFGAPFVVLMIILGHGLGTGIADMWYISPFFHGLGIALQLYCTFVSIFSTASISWILAYLSDTIVKNNEEYKWVNCSKLAHPGECEPSVNCSKMNFIALNVWTYLKYEVLEQHLLQESYCSTNRCVAILGIWMLVYALLFKRVTTFGKLSSLFGSLNICIFLAVVLKMTAHYGDGMLFDFDGHWSEVLGDYWSWARAMKEVFFTWIIFGVALMQLCGHMKITKDLGSFILAVLTTITLLFGLTIMLGFCIRHGLERHGVNFIPSILSNNASTVTGVSSLVYSANCDSTAVYNQEAFRFKNFMMGDTFTITSSDQTFYQEMRVLTELIPCLLAAEGTTGLHGITAFLLYSSVVGFGVLQLASIWICFEETIFQLNRGTMRQWSPLISFSLCCLGAIIGTILLTKDAKMIMYMLDATFSSIWSMGILIAILILALKAISGSSYSMENLLSYISTTRISKYINRVLYVLWGLMLPYCLMIAVFALGSDVHLTIRVSWPKHVQDLSCFCQTVPLMIFAFCAIIKSGIYLGRRETFMEGFRELFCPELPLVPIYVRRSASTDNDSKPTDPPPRYSPPPSYSVATGRVASSELLRSHSTGQLENYMIRSQPSPAFGCECINLENMHDLPPYVPPEPACGGLNYMKPTGQCLSQPGIIATSHDSPEEILTGGAVAHVCASMDDNLPKFLPDSDKVIEEYHVVFDEKNKGSKDSAKPGKISENDIKYAAGSKELTRPITGQVSYGDKSITVNGNANPSYIDTENEGPTKKNGEETVRITVIGDSSHAIQDLPTDVPTRKSDKLDKPLFVEGLESNEGQGFGQFEAVKCEKAAGSSFLNCPGCSLDSFDGSQVHKLENDHESIVCIEEEKAVSFFHGRCKKMAKGKIKRSGSKKPNKRVFFHRKAVKSDEMRHAPLAKSEEKLKADGKNNLTVALFPKNAEVEFFEPDEKENSKD